jgi:glycosyltransferase involved in cell wall biosynthesis
MIMSRPVAATSVGGVPELIIDKETGLLSPPGNPVELADNIIWLLDHPAEAKKMGERARQKVFSDFNAERMIEQIESLYESSLEKLESAPHSAMPNGLKAATAKIARTELS